MARKRSRRAGPVGLSVDLGVRLREGRERKAMTVRGLAKSVGVSPALISLIERGRVLPSVATLYSITNQLGLVVDDLFRDATAPREEREKIAAAAQPVQRANGRETIRLSKGIRWERLTARPHPEVEFIYLVYDVGAESCDKDSMIRHGGMEYGLVISGRLGLKVGFEEFDLGPGDSISFDAQVPHRQWTIGKKPTEAVWVVHNRYGDDRFRTPSATRAARGSTPR